MCWRVPAGAPRKAFPPALAKQPAGVVPQDDEPGAKRVRLPGVLVTRDEGADESEGLEVLLGLYEPHGGQRNNGQPVFKKNANDAEEQAVFLYYWGNSWADRGWWLGHEVNGGEAYCWVPSHGFPPPARGWRIPTEEESFVEDLKVVYPWQGHAEAASSTADVSKAIGKVIGKAAPSNRHPQPQLQQPRPLPQPPQQPPPAAARAAVHAPTQPMVVPPKQAQGTADIRSTRPVAGQQARIVPVDVASCRPLAGTRLNGQIKKWNTNASMGFISSPSFFKGDLIARGPSVHALEGLPSAGREVSFELRFDALGNPEAYEVQEPVPVSSAAQESLALSAAEMPAEDAQFLDLFYKCLVSERECGQPQRKRFWHIVNSIKNQELDPELRSAAQIMLDKWGDGKAN